MKRLTSNPNVFLVCCAALCALLLARGPARADTREVAAAKAYLTDTNRAKGCLFFAHPTATYQRADVIRTEGDLVPGSFKVTVRYTWKSLLNDTNTSDLVYYFDARGRLTDLRAGPTTSFFPQFTAADTVIAAVKDELMKEVAKWNDANARQTAATLISRADARGLLALILQQAQP